MTSLAVSMGAAQAPVCTRTLCASVFLVFFGCLVGAGYNIGVLNAPQEILMEACNASVASDYGYILDQTSLDLVWSAVVAVFLVGATAGAMIGGTAADLAGRKMAIMFIQAVMAAAGVLMFAGYEKQRLHFFFLGRILVGLGTGLASVVCPLYVHEVAPAHLQHALGSVTNLGFCVGLVLSQALGLPQALGKPDTLQFLLGAFIVPTLLAAVALPFAPESPKYLLIKKDDEEGALKALSSLRGLPQEALSSEVACYRAEHKLALETPAWTVRRLVTDRETRGRVLVLVLLCAGQQFCGVNAVFFFSTAIFQRAGLSQSQGALASLGCGAANAALALLAGPCVARVPLRRLLTASCLGCALCLAVFAAAISLMDRYIWAAGIGVFSLIAYVVAFATGFGPIPWMLGAQIFDQGPKPTAISVGSATIWVSNFAVVLAFPALYAQIGVVCFVVFLVCSLVSAAVAHFHLPGSQEDGVGAKELEAAQV